MIKFLLSIFLIESAVLLLASIDTGSNIITIIGTIIIAFTTAITTIVVTWINYKVAKLNVKVDKYHTEVNGKMGLLLDATEKAGKAEGKAEGRKEKQEETDAKGTI